MKPPGERDADRPAPAIDWQAARERIEAAELAMVNGPALDGDRDRALLEQRARALAKVAADEDAPDFLEIVAFAMAHEHYGVAASFVREVYPLKELTPIPGAPEFVLGIVNIRGRVLSLINLKTFFSLPEQGLAEQNQIIVLSSPDMEFGVLADSVLGVRVLYPSELQADFPAFTGLRKEYLLGVSPDGTVVLDARRILADPNIVVRDDGFK